MASNPLERSQNHLKKISKITLVSLTVSLLSAIELPLSAVETTTDCVSKNKRIYGEIANRIEKSSSVKLIALSCEDIKAIDNIDSTNILLTTGRKEGSPTICVTDNRNNPCMFHIAKVIDNKNSSNLLLSIFGENIQSYDVLNETTERLFIRPSSIIR